MVIRVHIEDQPPAAKRQRTTESTSTDAARGSADIPAHSLVLCARSTYFDRSLGGDWAEAAEQRVELALESTQALDDLKLLIKLSYSDSYTHDDGQLLPPSTRLRLAALADALEFVEAVDQLLVSLNSLPHEIGIETALARLDELPPALHAHPGTVAAWGKMARVLATHLGFVADMFEHSDKRGR